MNKLIYYLIIIFLHTNSTNGQNILIKLEKTDKETTTIEKKQNGKLSTIRINKFVDSICNDLSNKGYLNLEVIDLINKNEKKIKLNEKINYANISYNDLTKKARKLLDIYTNQKIISFSLLKKHKQTLLKKLTEKGHSLSLIYYENTKFSNDTIYTKLKTKLDIKRKIDKIEFKPYTKFPKGIKKFILKENKIFNKQSLKNLESELKKIPFIEIIKKSDIQFNNKYTTLFVYAKKKKVNQIEGLIGFSTNPNSGKIEFNGHINGSMRNIFNYGEKINLNWNNNGKGISTIKIKTEIPYIFKSNFAWVNKFKLSKQDSTMQNKLFNTQLMYHLTLTNRIGIGIEHLNSTNPSKTKKDFKTTYYTIKYHHLHTTQRSRFTEEETINIKVGYGKKNNYENTTNNQIIGKINANKTWKLSNRNYINQSLEVFYLKSKESYRNELYTFGGNQSIRGYNENSLFTSKLLGLYNEYRYLISKNIYANTINDFAYYKNYNNYEFIMSIGAGIGVRTKSGFLKLNYAIGKHDNFKTDNSRIHISFISIF